MHTQARFAVLAAALGAAAGAAHAAIPTLVPNGGFDDATNFVVNAQDTDTLAGGSTAMPHWTVLPGRSINWIGPANTFALTGNHYYLDLSGNLTGFQGGGPFGGVTSDVATIPGRRYLLMFDMQSSFKYGGDVAITASAGSASGTFEVDSHADQSLALERLIFRAAGPTTTIQLVGAKGVDYIGLDDVKLGRAPGRAPEPAAWAMLGLGLFGIGGLLRRRGHIPAPG
jgi:hypothetical protein